jgi:hypothetical protein
MQRLYILRGREPFEVPSLEDWYEWFATAGIRRVVARTVLSNVVVFTAFQGLDVPPAAPRLPGEVYPFESVVLGGPLHGMRQSYKRWTDAERGHAGLLALASSSRERCVAVR